MPGYTLYTQDDSRIIVIEENSELDFTVEGEEMVSDIVAALDASSHRSVVIFDARAYNLDNLNAVLAIGSLARSHIGKTFAQHPNLIKILSTTNNKVMQMTVKGINSATFGHIDVGMYATLEEALNSARDLLYGQSALA